ncbi:2634_t:CDS:2 [Ambispora gerdemannii]|uniref:2634_t:CDS:1 n=1 Tax=Ambispora gerdemannii TaxID=144530 RepID=A0A9N8VRK6_9GLOM|nr:2634_t:CDS:2 [Ambispora gerdemannii]
MYTSLSALQCLIEREEMKRQQNNNAMADGMTDRSLRINGKKLIEDGNKHEALHIDERNQEKLERIEMSILPHMQNIVIVLLKLLLATVSSNSNANSSKSSENSENKPSSSNGGEGSAAASHSTKSNTVEEVDIMRHREITSKAVSAILILMLKHFKLSHALKFEYLSQLLVDSNCLLLILKMFGLQDVALATKANNEVAELNFFQFCAVNAQKENVSNKLKEPEVTGEIKPVGQEDDESSTKAQDDDETEFCWRNFFAAINFLKILQKLTKKKTHRISLLVQYKSSAILKRILKVPHPLLELYALKVLKNQIPFVGRKWRQSNMKVITSIFLKCRPDLRDEWISSTDADAELDDALAKQALRESIKFYNTRHYLSQNGEKLPNGSSNHQDDKGYFPDIFPPNHTQPFKLNNAAYIDDIMLDDNFLSNWEQWLHDEVYSFSVTRPHLRGINEYYTDDHMVTFFGDGSEWEAPLSPVDDENKKDPFTSVSWDSLTRNEYTNYQEEWRNNNFKLTYDEDDMEHVLQISDVFDEDPVPSEANYRWPDEMLGPFVAKEITIYDPPSSEENLQET